MIHQVYFFSMNALNQIDDIFSLQRLLAQKIDMVGIVLISATVKIHFIVIVSMDQLTNANVSADISIHHFVNQV